MWLKKICCLLLACAVSTGCLGMNVGAVPLEDQAKSLAIERASGRFSMEVYKHEVVSADTSFPLEVGETVTINAVYSPQSASVDFGLIAPDGLFYSIRAQKGSFNETIEVNQRGYYTLAIRNNSDIDISVSGFVTY